MKLPLPGCGWFLTVTRRSRRDFSIVHNVTSRQLLPDFHILIYKTEACRVFETDAGHDPSPKALKAPVPQGQH